MYKMEKKENLENIIFIDFKPAIFDEEAKKMNVGRVCRGNYRLTNGLWRTNKEKEIYLKSSLEREMP